MTPDAQLHTRGGRDAMVTRVRIGALSRVVLHCRQGALALLRARSCYVGKLDVRESHMESSKSRRRSKRRRVAKVKVGTASGRIIVPEITAPVVAVLLLQRRRLLLVLRTE